MAGYIVIPFRMGSAVYPATQLPEMALDTIDTAAERFSMMGVGGIDVTMPLPDGTSSAGDRLHLLDLYSRSA